MPHTDTSPTYPIKFPPRLLLTIIAVAAALLIWHALHIFLLIFAGMLFGIFLWRTGHYISSRTRLSTGWSISIFLILMLALTALIIWLMAPSIMDQVNRLNQQWPDSMKELKQMLSGYSWGEWLVNHTPDWRQFTGSMGGWMQKAAGWLYTVFGAITGLFIILFIGIYLAYDADIYRNGMIKMVQPDRRDEAKRTLHAIGITLYWWLIGRIVSMMIIGVFTGIGLWLLGIPLALTLAVFAAVMTFIPNIGPFISAIPAVLLALPEGWTMAGYVVLLYAGIQTVESYMITPLVQRQMIAMPPALIISAQLILGFLQGILGILLATPLVAAIIVLVKLLYVKDILHDDHVKIQAEAREN